MNGFLARTPFYTQYGQITCRHSRDNALSVERVKEMPVNSRGARYIRVILVVFYFPWHKSWSTLVGARLTFLLALVMEIYLCTHCHIHIILAKKKLDQLQAGKLPYLCINNIFVL